MSFYLSGCRLSDKSDESTEDYEIFYIRYYRTQFFQNFVTNILTNYETEQEKNGDWDKNFPDHYFKFPISNATSGEEFFKHNINTDTSNLNKIRNDIKNSMNLSKDYYYVFEELALLEFMELYNSVEDYLRNVYRKLIMLSPKELSKTLASKVTYFFKKDDITNILEGIIESDHFVLDNRDKLVQQAIDKVVFNYFMDNNLVIAVDYIFRSLLSNEARGIVYREIGGDGFKNVIDELTEMVKLRNCHIHANGLKDGKYQNISGLYGIDTFRGIITTFLPCFDKAIALTLKN